MPKYISELSTVPSTASTEYSNQPWCLNQQLKEMALAEQVIEVLFLWFLNKYIPLLRQFQLEDLHVPCAFERQLRI